MNAKNKISCSVFWPMLVQFILAIACLFASAVILCAYNFATSQANAGSMLSQLGAAGWILEAASGFAASSSDILSLVPSIYGLTLITSACGAVSGLLMFLERYGSSRVMLFPTAVLCVVQAFADVFLGIPLLSAWFIMAWVWYAFCIALIWLLSREITRQKDRDAEQAEASCKPSTTLAQELYPQLYK